jgi:Domain of unknown function (DUF4160)
MPLVSAFYGILIYMYWLDTKRHHSPHIHAEYAGSEAVFSIAESELMEGSMPPRQIRLIQAWIEIHREELMADWTLAIRGETLVKIDPLR